MTERRTTAAAAKGTTTGTTTGAAVTKSGQFSDWYHRVVFDYDLLRYYDISGCYVVLPRAYKMWEKIQGFLDGEFKGAGVDNVYFPLLISAGNLSRETSHL